jgi:Tfp pilus assembly protein PilP
MRATGVAAFVLWLIVMLPAISEGQAAPETSPAPQAGRGAAPAGPQPAVPVAPLEPQGYTYSAAGRRDPFVSLLRRGSDVAGSPTGQRPAGIAGMTAAEVVLKGTIRDKAGWLGMLQGTDNKTYLVRTGDRLLDGTVRTITADTLVILQRVNDPLSLATTREVRKMLRQTEEANK